MSENLQNLLREALLNNSYDYQSMHDTINTTWKNSFSYLYALQKSYIEYEELFYFSNTDTANNSKLIGNFYVNKNLKVAIDVDYDLISTPNREDFRKSEFYGKLIPYKELVYNPDIFTKIPIVIIDDNVVWDFELNINKDTTNMVFPFRRNFIISDERNEDGSIKYINHKIQILIVDNIFYQRIKLNRNSISLNTSTKSFVILKNNILSDSIRAITDDVYNKYLKLWKTNMNGLTQNQKDIIEKEKNSVLKLNTLPTQEGSMFCSFHPGNKVLGSKLIYLEETTNSYKGSFSDLTDEEFKKLSDLLNTDIYISLCFFNRLKHHRFYTGEYNTTATNEGADLFVLEKEDLVPYNMPIPVEDLMIFKRDPVKGYILEKNTEMVEMFYPNIYRIKDETIKTGDVYDIYYFYHEANDLKYTVLFDFYYKYLARLKGYQSIEKTINDIYYNKFNLDGYNDKQKTDFKTVFDKVIHYQYYNHQYGESDFLNRYLKEEGNEDKEPIEYKDETLKNWIKVQPWVLRDYVLDQKKMGESYHLFTNTLDLNSRLRMDTHIEFGEYKQVFDEPRYVFAFNNEKEYPILLNCRVFVDGIMVVDVYHDRHLFMDYLYIPANMVTKDSYIELEIFPEYSYTQDISFDSFEDEKQITLVEPSDVIVPTLQDVYITDPETLYRYNYTYFDTKAIYERGEFEAETIDYDKPVEFVNLSTFKIKSNTSDLLNKPLKLSITKTAKALRFIVDRDGYAYIEIRDTKFNFNIEYFRVFKNGRLVPQSRYKIMRTETVPVILFKDYLKTGDLIYIDITPFKYKQIYYKEELTANDTLIDLKSIINKPFDIRYYDVYINSRKLSLNNVFSITPWEITLVNLKSNYNLIIYEKERDWEYFGLDYNNHNYYFNLDDLFNSGFVSDEIKNEIIKDIIDDNKDERLNIYPNTNDEEKIDYTGSDIVDDIYYSFDLFYFDELIPSRYMNPDILQEDRINMITLYKEILDNYSIGKNVICLDPDIICSGREDESEEDVEMVVFDVGHMEDLPDDILNQEIEIPINGNIDK